MKKPRDRGAPGAGERPLISCLLFVFHIPEQALTEEKTDKESDESRRTEDHGDRFAFLNTETFRFAGIEAFPMNNHFNGTIITACRPKATMEKQVKLYG